MDPIQFREKSYLVTGGASGIGLACVTHLIKYGAYVYAVDLHEKKSPGLETLKSENLTYFQNNVKDRNSCHEVVSHLVRKYGRLDGIVNCAGVTLQEGELPGDDFYDKIMDVNLRGVWNMTTEALVQMQKQGSGSIVIIGSIGAVVGQHRLALYTSSKHAVLGLTRSWALDFAKYGIRVNCICPGTLFLFLKRKRN